MTATVTGAGFGELDVTGRAKPLHGQAVNPIAEGGSSSVKARSHINRLQGGTVVGAIPRDRHAHRLARQASDTELDIPSNTIRTREGAGCSSSSLVEGMDARG